MGGGAVQTSDGGYALAETYYFPGDFWLVKTDEEGYMKWNRTYGRSPLNVAESLIQTSDGEYALAGSIMYRDASYPVWNDNAWLVRTDSAGNVEWNRTYGGRSDDYAFSVVQTSDGGYVLAGSTSGIGGSDLWMVKTNSSGSVEWSNTYGGPDYDFALSLVQMNDGGYVLAGSTTSYGAGGFDFWLVKIVPQHDVAVTGIKAWPSPVLKTEPININITVENEGHFPETFEVAVYADKITDDLHINIETLNVSLNIGESKLLEFVWNTTSLPDGSYCVTAEALLPEDAKPQNNKACIHMGKETSSGSGCTSRLVLE